MLEKLRRSDLSAERDVPLAKHSSFRIGGRAKLAVFPRDRRELTLVLELLSRMPHRQYTVVGRGSNLVFPDGEYDGMIVFTHKVTEVRPFENGFYADAGVSVTYLSKLAERRGLSGMEFLWGIPGTVGGGVVMNAGAYGGCIGDICVRSFYFDPTDRTVKTCEGKDQHFGYRTSFYSEHPEYTVLGAEFLLTPTDPSQVRVVMDEFLKKRKATQPLSYPNAGSVFKRPEGHFAAKLIDECGLKGTSIGGAMVSTKHAGFIVNTGNATAEDIRALTELIKQTVYDRTGVMLECEIRFL